MIILVAYNNKDVYRFIKTLLQDAGLSTGIFKMLIK
jgi:hypothetical protein